jgi:hypothetical protein
MEARIADDLASVLAPEPEPDQDPQPILSLPAEEQITSKVNAAG